MLIIAEYFIENGYAVVFLHRKFSLLPYSRHYSHTTNCFLDFIVEGPNGNLEGFFVNILPDFSRSEICAKHATLASSVQQSNGPENCLISGENGQSFTFTGLCYSP